MALWLMIIAVLALWPGTTHYKGHEYHKDYMTWENTLAVKGVFVLLIFASHFIGYVNLADSIPNSIYWRIRAYLGQMVVAPFLFYSGYGISVSVKAKGLTYIKSFPFSRILKTGLKFWLAVTLYLFYSVYRQRGYTTAHVVQAYLGLKSIGNSDWYVLMVLVLYICFYVAQCITTNTKSSMLLILLFTVAYTAWQISWGRPEYCYNTAFVFSGGFAFPCIKEKFEKHVFNDIRIYSVFLIISIFTFLILHHYWEHSFIIYNLVSLLFMTIIIALTAKVEIRNPILQFFGRNVFGIYILQRLPMMILKNKMGASVWLYFTCAFLLTIALSKGFDWFFDWLWQNLSHVQELQKKA